MNRRFPVLDCREAAPGLGFWDLYFCGSYGKIEKQLFDMGGSRFQNITSGRSARRTAGDRSEVLKGRGMSRETKEKVRPVDRGKAFGRPLRRAKRFACPDEPGGLRGQGLPSPLGSTPASSDRN